MRVTREDTLEIVVRSFEETPLEGAHVVVRRKGELEREIELRFDTERESYVATGLSPGSYEARAEAEGLEPQERSISIPSRGRPELFVLGEEGMPFYYRGRVRVPFRPPRGLIGVAVDPSQEGKGRLRDYATELGLREEPKTPRPVLDDNVLVFRLPARTSAARADELLERLLGHPSTRTAGPLVRLGDQHVEFLTNQLVVKFDGGVTSTEAAGLAREFGLEVVRPVPYSGNTYLLSSPRPASFDLLAACDGLVESGRVEWAEPNLVVTAADLQINPTDFLYPEQWHVPIVTLPAAWQTLRNANPAGVVPGSAGDRTFGSESIVIAVLDRGIQSATTGGVTAAAHPDFQGTVTGGAQKVAQFFDFSAMVGNNDAPPNDHGMGCAGVAGARANNASAVAGVNEGVVGAAPNSRLLGLIRSAVGGEIRYSDAYVWLAGFNPGWTIDGVNYFPGQTLPAPPTVPADIVTNSFGWAAWPISGLMSDTIDFCTTYGRGGRGLLMLFAAGNGGTSFPSQAGLAAHPKAIAVAASSLANDGVTEVRAPYSNFGTATDVIDFCTPSHDAYVGGVVVHNPAANYGVISADLVNGGDLPGSPLSQTALTAAAAAGATTITVASTAGVAAGQAVLIGAPGAPGTEGQPVTAVPSATQLTVSALRNAHPAGSPVAAGPANYTDVFGGTSSATPLAAGIAALVLSIRPSLSWVEAREILRTTADQIDFANTDPVGQWVDTDGDGVNDYSRWYGYGRLNANAAVTAARDYAVSADIVVRENLADTGAVPSAGWHAHSPDIWVRRTDDPIPALGYGDAPPDQKPRRGQTNYVYCRVKNVGSGQSNEVYVRAMITHYPGFEFRYPNEFTPTNAPGPTPSTPLTLGTYLIDEVLLDDLPPSADPASVQIVKMTWPSSLVPPATVVVGGSTVNWHPCLLLEASPHDGPIPAGATFDIKRDNNIAQRNIEILDPTDPADDTGDFTAIAMGTSARDGVEALVVDRSLLPLDAQLVVRLADQKLMERLVHWVKGDRPSGVSVGDRLVREGCRIRLITRSRLEIECCGKGSIIVEAAPGTRIEWFDQGAAAEISLGRYAGTDVVEIGPADAALELPVRLAGGEFTFLLVALPNRDEVNEGELRLTQRRGDGELSAGFTIVP